MPVTAPLIVSILRRLAAAPLAMMTVHLTEDADDVWEPFLDNRTVNAPSLLI